MSTIYTNFFSATLSSAITAGSTTIAATALADLAVVAAPDTMWAVLDPTGVDGAPEIVKITAHTAASTGGTVARAQQGTTARSHAIGTVVVVAITKSDLDGLPHRILTARGSIIVASAAHTAAELVLGASGLPLVSDGTDVTYAQVGTAGIADDAITAAKIASGAEGSTELASDSVTSAKIAVDAVTATAIAAGAVGTTEIADDAVTAAKVATGAIGTTELADDSVTAAKIAAGAVGASEIDAGAVGTSELADDAVTSAKIAADAVGSSEIATGAVGTTELADDAVTAAKIATGAVGTTEVADDAITSAKIATDAVTSAEIAADAVGAAEIADGVIVDAHMAAGDFPSVKNIYKDDLCGSVYYNTSASVTDSTWTGAGFNTERYDYGAMHSTTVSSSRITAAVAGTYNFNGYVTWANNGVGSRRIRFQRYNSSSAAQEIFAMCEADAGDEVHPVTVSTGGDVAMAAGDYVVMEVFQGSGGSLNGTAFVCQWHCLRTA